MTLRVFKIQQPTPLEAPDAEIYEKTSGSSWRIAMRGYVMLFIEGISSPQQMALYQPEARATIAAAGGRVLIGYGKNEVVEPGENITGAVLIEFDSYEAAQTWYHSPAYQKAKELRKNAAKTQAVIAEGE